MKSAFNITSTFTGKSTRTIKTIVMFALLLLLMPVYGQDAAEQSSLQGLLQQLKQQREQQRREWQAREQRFLTEQKQQQAKLEQARADTLRQQQSLQPLQAEVDKLAADLQALEQSIDNQGKQLRALQGAFSRIAGEVAAGLQQSPVALQHPARGETLERLAALQTLPTIDDLESLWLLTQEEMTESAVVSRFQGQYVDGDGRRQSTLLTRVGVFTVFDDAGFFQYLPETQELLRPVVQPPARYLQTIDRFLEQSSDPHNPGPQNPGLQTLVVDPSRGALIKQFGHAVTLRERIDQAGWIGVIILTLGAIGLLVSTWRILYLLWVTLKVNAQLKRLDAPVPNNPLGRVLLQAERFPAARDENYQFKLDERVLAELPALERGQNFIKLLAAVAPLLGLLGTVTGMILTFQSISLFGNGDPKLMAGGISQALMTTVLGLVVAIPLLFSHSFVVAMSRSLVQRLDEQSAGLLAARVQTKGDHHD